MDIIKPAYLIALAIAFAFPTSARVEHADPSEYVDGTTVKKLLSTKTTSIGQAIEYPHSSNPEVTALEVEIPPGMETGWHTHPFPGYGYIRSGVLTLEVEGGKRLHYHAGEAFAEMVDVAHNGVNSGTKPVRILAFFTGESGKPYTVHASAR
jgi:quercetin dioxygenase-like cupin family protein